MADKMEVHCPYCGSDDVSKPRLSGAVFAISFLLLGIPLPFMSKTYHCFNCDKDFKKGTQKEVEEPE